MKRAKTDISRPDPIFAGGGDGFLIKYDPSGTRQWTAMFGTAADERITAVAVSGGDIFVTGSTAGGLDGNTNSGDADAFVIKYNLAGVKQ